MDEYGIPRLVAHRRPVGRRDDLWDYVHTLDQAFVSAHDGSEESYRTVCLVCAKKNTVANQSPWAWKRGLRNINNTSNGKVHFISQHPDHPIAEAAKEQQARAADAAVKMYADSKVRKQPEDSRASTSSNKKRRVSIQELLRPSIDQVNNAISEWVTEEGKDEFVLLLVSIQTIVLTYC